MDNKLKVLLSDIFKIPVDDVLDDLTMKDSGFWDSLKHMELIVGIEDVFETELSSDEIVKMQSVGEIKQILKEKLTD